MKIIFGRLSPIAWTYYIAAFTLWAMYDHHADRDVSFLFVTVSLMKGLMCAFLFSWVLPWGMRVQEKVKRRVARLTP